MVLSLGPICDQTPYWTQLLHPSPFFSSMRRKQKACAVLKPFHWRSGFRGPWLHQGECLHFLTHFFCAYKTGKNHSQDAPETAVNEWITLPASVVKTVCLSHLHPLPLWVLKRSSPGSPPARRELPPTNLKSGLSVHGSADFLAWHSAEASLLRSHCRDRGGGEEADCSEGGVACTKRLSQRLTPSVVGVPPGVVRNCHAPRTFWAPGVSMEPRVARPVLPVI